METSHPDYDKNVDAPIKLVESLRLYHLTTPSPARKTCTECTVISFVKVESEGQRFLPAYMKEYKMPAYGLCMVFGRRYSEQIDN